MNKQATSKPTQAENRIRRSTLITVVCDALLIVALLVCLLSFNAITNKDTYAQNAENIVNIATGKSQLMLAALDHSSQTVRRAYRYCDGKSVTDILDYLAHINLEGEEYQLLKRDEAQSSDLSYLYAGWSTKKKDGEYQRVEYKNTDLSSSLNQYEGQAIGEVCYSQSFTNKTDAMRYFAAFCAVNVEEDGAQARYYLVKPQNEDDVLARLQSFSQYQELTTAICYADGKYLARDSAFRSDNFYDYLYSYNGLSLDERNAVRAAVRADEDGAGILEYQDHKNRDCVFAYAACDGDGQWYVVVSVPASEFVAEQPLSFFPLIIIIFLAVLLVFNTWRLLIIVGQLRQSVSREQTANTSKSQFLSRMSHEIRTPLNAVIGYNMIAKNALTEGDGEQKQTEIKVLDCLVKSDIASKHLLTIINDVLDMSAIESGKIKVARDRFDFKGLITSLTTVFYSQARAKGVDFEVIFDTFTEEWFLGDQTRVNQILTNILSNAIKFTPEGGTVKLKIQQPEKDVNASHIHFEISDTGIGMTPEYMERIWLPFEQADASISRRFGGTGLGLSITKNLVDLMGGRISVQSEPGKGTTFGIDLTFERTEQPKSNAVYDFSTVNALVVDDDPSTCDYIRLLFDRCGAKCTAVTSGAAAVEAMTLAMRGDTPYTLCLVDWRMPGMDGVETIKRIRKVTGAALPIIVLTAYDYVELTDSAARIGINKFISKPLFQSSLFDSLASVTGKKAPTALQREGKMDFGGARVLLAEDNAMNMEIAKVILKSANLAVTSAWNGKEAVELFESAAPGTFMAILMDVHMPVMDGHEATRTIRASAHPEAKTIPIIAMTADAFAENVAEAHAAGMNAHIAKPIDVALLFEMLKKHGKQS